MSDLVEQAQQLADQLDLALANHPDTDCPPVCEVGSAAADALRSVAALVVQLQADLTKKETEFRDMMRANAEQASRRSGELDRLRADNTALRTERDALQIGKDQWQASAMAAESELATQKTGRQAEDQRSTPDGRGVPTPFVRNGSALAGDHTSACPICGEPGGFHDDSEQSPHIHLRPLQSDTVARPQPVKLCNCGQPVGEPGTAACRNPRHSGPVGGLGS